MRLPVVVVIVIIVVVIVALVAVVVVGRTFASLLVNGGSLSQTFIVALEIEACVRRAFEDGLHRLSVHGHISI